LEVSVGELLREAIALTVSVGVSLEVSVGELLRDGTGVSLELPVGELLRDANGSAGSKNNAAGSTAFEIRPFDMSTAQNTNECSSLSTRAGSEQ
jgi:hypothetical protein